MYNELKIAACYIRVSTNKQEELSPDSQLKEIKKWAAANGYIIPSEYVFMEQEGISGKNAAKRQEFQKMIATAKVKPKPFEAIILWKFSRFARNQDESAFYKSLLRKKLGIEVISISEPIMDGMYGRLIEMIIEWSDEFYSINLSGEVMRGMSEKARRGGYQSALPMGYKMNKSSGIPEFNPEEIKIVRQIFDWYDNGFSAFEITQRLNDIGIKTQKGNQFEVRVVKYILENPFYIGKVRWNRQHHESHSIKDKSQWIIADGKHEPAVSAEQWERVQSRIQSRNAKFISKKHATQTKKHWLSGMVYCSSCGCGLYSSNPKYFQCGNYMKGKCRDSHLISKNELSRAIIDALNNVMLHTDTIEYETKLITPAEDEMSFYTTAIKRLAKKEARIKEAYRDGIDTLEEYKENKKIINAERMRLNAQYEKLAESIAIKKENVPDFKAKLQNSVDIISNPESTDEAKHEALTDIAERIVFDKSENSIDIKLVNYI